MGNVDDLFRLLFLLGMVNRGAHPGDLPAHAAGNAMRGAELFAQQCASCHKASTGKNDLGPSLADIARHRSTTVANVVCSNAMKQSGMTSPQGQPQGRTDNHVADPEKMLPDRKMRYGGLENARDRADLLAFLSTLR